MSEQGQLLAEGKTKRIWEVVGSPYEVLIENKDDVTAGDGAKRDQIALKAIASTVTGCHCFRYLTMHEVRSHFVRPVNRTMFLARRLIMIPIEVIARGVATGSYLKRNPQVEEGTRFERIEVEFMYKDDELHDPFMVWNAFSRAYDLFDHNKPLTGPALKVVSMQDVGLGQSEEERQESIEVIKTAMVEAFLLLEAAWDMQGVTLCDLKLEFGRDAETGEILLGDVVTNDEWRIWQGGEKSGERSKQRYREGADLASISRDYAWVAEAVSRFGT